MEYSYLELLAYLLIYSFIGWVVEVSIISIREKRFCNRGFFNLPLCLSYGIIMDIFIIVLPTIGRNYILQFIIVHIVSSVVGFLSASVTKHISRQSLWNYDEANLFTGTKSAYIISVLVALIYLMVEEIIHPVIFMMIHFIPKMVTLTVSSIIMVILVLDFISIIFVTRKSRYASEIDAINNQGQLAKIRLSQRIYNLIWKRIKKAYPNMKAFDDSGNECVFGKFSSFDKLIWVFLISAFLGDVIETIFCRITAGVWMSRSSVIYGTFSIVWGVGAVLLTIVLQKLRDKEDRYIFFFGCLIGGVYEYMCSVFTEVFFGTVFWDYSHIPFNIGGRTNLLFCVFWGILAVIWVKAAYPRLSTLIEKIPPIAGKVATWIIIVFMVCNGCISAVAMVRYTNRIEGKPAGNVVESFFDEHYDDELVEKIWPNMKIH